MLQSITHRRARCCALSTDNVASVAEQPQGYHTVLVRYHLRHPWFRVNSNEPDDRKPTPI